MLGIGQVEIVNAGVNRTIISIFVAINSLFSQTGDVMEEGLGRHTIKIVMAVTDCQIAKYYVGIATVEHFN